MQEQPPETSISIRPEVIGYAQHSTPSAEGIAREVQRRKRPSAKSPSHEAKAVIGIVACTLIGLALGPGKGSAGSMMIAPILGCTVWFVVARLNRRKTTPSVFKAIMFLAALSALWWTAATVFAGEGTLFWSLANQDHTQAKAKLVGASVALFATAEAAAFVYRFMLDKRKPQVTAIVPTGNEA